MNEAGQGVRTVALTVALGLLGACGSGDDRPAVEGELGQGNFRYVCVGNSDPYCEDPFPDGGFPPFAVGGRFDLDYEPNDDIPRPRVIPATDAAIDEQAGVLVLLRAGYAAVLAVDAYGEVIDLRHLLGHTVEGFAITVAGGETAVTTVEMVSGDQIDLIARPQDINGTTLAGSLAYTWTEDPGNEAIFVSGQQDRDERVTISAFGEASDVVYVEAGGHTQEIRIEVTAAPIPGTSGPPPGTSGPPPGTSGDATTGDGSSDSGSTGEPSTGGSTGGTATTTTGGTM